ncbi:hypothetical protein CEXT_451461 [Caerostris extrusa]|uniref:Uncharacterized protein n=1 Tax=Caerostris extrusa TaxID=172846 RepID=A0AAV4Y5X6_CAEEX|nr:hypothetical protein CEXT_451461 [Caerostris extrusa]
MRDELKFKDWKLPEWRATLSFSITRKQSDAQEDFVITYSSTLRLSVGNRRQKRKGISQKRLTEPLISRLILVRYRMRKEESKFFDRRCIPKTTESQNYICQ